MRSFLAGTFSCGIPSKASSSELSMRSYTGVFHRYAGVFRRGPVRQFATRFGGGRHKLLHRRVGDEQVHRVVGRVVEDLEGAHVFDAHFAIGGQGRVLQVCIELGLFFGRSHRVHPQFVVFAAPAFFRPRLGGGAQRAERSGGQRVL
jgi:hypothetical protein